MDFSDFSTLRPFLATVGQSARATMPSAQGDVSITDEIKAPSKRHIDSFDTWLQGWNAYEKLDIASHHHW